MSAPTVGLALIAKDEANTLPTLLASIEGAFDRVVLVDTGSTDGTPAVFLGWAQEQVGMTYSFADFDWGDDFAADRLLDFAAARTAADQLLLWGKTNAIGQQPGPPLVDWKVWADCDDRLDGAPNLRPLAAQAPDHVVAFIADYAYGYDQHGNCVCTLRRERLVRAGHGQWIGMVHEAQIYDGLSTIIDPQICRWVHLKPPADKPSDRNLRILRAWHETNPTDPRVLMYLGVETAARGLHQEALGYYQAYLALKSGWDEERAQVHRKYAQTLFALGETDAALEAGLQALKVLPAWTDSYLTLAQACHNLGEHAKAIHWATEVLQRGMPDSLLILNPLDYTFEPLMCLAAAHGALGQMDEAVTYAEQALALVPDHPGLRQYHHRWATVRKRDSTANTFAACAQLLVEHDEQYKALRLLEEAVPHYVVDHPVVVQLRSAIRERVRPLLEPAGMAEHYLEATEIGIPDLSIVEHLPRAQFLLDGLREQAGEAA